MSGWGHGPAARPLTRPTRPGRSSAALGASAGLRARSARARLVRDLAERVLDAEVREVQVLLVDDRRDPRVDLDHVLADELDVEEVVELELARRSCAAISISAGSSSVSKYIASPARIASRVFGWPSTIRPPSRDPVDRPLLAGARAPSRAARSASSPSSSSELLEPQRLGDAGAVRQQLLVRGRRDAERMRKPREPGREDRLHADVLVRVAELARRGRDRLAAADPPPGRARHADPVEQRVRLGLVVRAADRLGRGDEHRDTVEARRCASARPSRSNDDCGSTASTPSRSADLEHRVGEAGSDAGRHEVERVAEVPPDRALGHVGADERAPRRSPFSRSARRSAAVPGDARRRRRGR